MKNKLSLMFLAVVVAAIAGCAKTAEPAGFITTNENGQFIRNGKPYYYVGANYWSGPILASDGFGGDMNRLVKDLDVLKEAGVTNLRVLAGSDAPCKNNNSIYPVLQYDGGELNDTLLVGLDRFLVELAKRDMVAVLYLNNGCPWSGGFIYYLRNCFGTEPANFYTPDYSPYVSDFIRYKEPQKMFFEFIKKIVTRTNSITGVPYIEDPTIMSWQIANEPRAYSDELHPQFVEFINETADLIRSLDPNHMISTGSEGQQGCEHEPELFEKIHANPNISYLTYHIWPENWGIVNQFKIAEEFHKGIEYYSKEIENHTQAAANLGKPIVIEEFGFSRDLPGQGLGEYTDHDLTPGGLCTYREKFYDFVFDYVRKSHAEGGRIAGCNIWSYAGTGRQVSDLWKPGDDFVGDPPFEPQGRYSFYDCDYSTMDMIRKTNEEVSK